MNCIVITVFDIPTYKAEISKNLNPDRELQAIKGCLLGVVLRNKIPGKLLNPRWSALNKQI